MAAGRTHSLRPLTPTLAFGPPRFESGHETVELPSPTLAEEGVTSSSRPLSRVSSRLLRSLPNRLPSLRERSHETTRENCPSPAESISPITPEYLAYLAHCPKSDPIDILEECPLEVQQRCGKQLRTQENGNLTMDMVTPSDTSARGFFAEHNVSSRDAEASPMEESRGQVKDDTCSGSFSSSVYDHDDTSRQEGSNAPTTPPMENIFAEKDLQRYSRANDDLDNLMSEEGSGDESAHDTIHPAATDAKLAAHGWQSVVTPMTGKSTMSHQVTRPSPESIEAWKRKVRQGSWDTPKVPHSSPLLSSSNGKFATKAHGNFTFHAQIDGISERHFLRSTDSDEDGLDGCQGHGKRKASTFSLLSLSHPFATPKESKGKRQRLSIRRFASNVATSLSEVTRRIRDRHMKDRHRLGAWGTRRRVGKSNNTISGSSCADGSMDPGEHVSGDWWQEGASKYEAPSWMRFGSKLVDDSLASKMAQLRFRPHP